MKNMTFLIEILFDNKYRQKEKQGYVTGIVTTPVEHMSGVCRLTKVVVVPPVQWATF